MQAVILAAGRSKRFWPLNEEHKSSFVLFGKPLLIHTLISLQASGLVDQAIVIHAPNSAIPTMVQNAEIELPVRFLEQPSPDGTGDAFSLAIPYINKEFLVVWPDMVNVDMFLKQMVDVKQKHNAEAVLLGAPTATPENFGMFRFQDDIISEVIEKPASQDAPSNIKRVGVEIFDQDFTETYQALKVKTELALIDAINDYITLRDKKIMLSVYRSNIPVLKYPWDTFAIMDILENTVQNGDVCVGDDCVIKHSATIGRNVVFEGKIYIGNNVHIGDNTRIVGPVSIDKDTTIERDSIIQHSIIGQNSHIGSCELFDSIIGNNVTIHNNFSFARDKRNPDIQANRRIGVIVGNNTTIAQDNTSYLGVLIDQNVVTRPGDVITNNIKA